MTRERSTRFAVGLEQGPDGSVLAHGLDLPGCTGFGQTAEAATAAFERALAEWLGFLAASREAVPPAGAELEIAVDEWVSTDADVSAGETTACFAADLRALTQDEIDRGLRLLGELRARTLGHVKRRPPALMDAETEAGWTVRQILEELARAQWWTVSRLGSTPLGDAPDDTLGRLDTALALTGQYLGFLPPEQRGLRLEIDGEEWTPRKTLRRLLWLEWSLGRAATSALAPTTPPDGR